MSSSAEPPLSLYAALLDALSEGTIVLDQAHRCVYANAAAGEVFGAPREKLVGAVFDDLSALHRGQWSPEAGPRGPAASVPVARGDARRPAPARHAPDDGDISPQVREVVVLAREGPLRVLFLGAVRRAEARDAADQPPATRRAERLRAAAELAAMAAAASDAAQLYQDVAERAAALLDAEWGTVQIHDPATNQLQLRANGGPRPYPLTATLPPGCGTAGVAFITGEPVLTNDYAQFDAAWPESLAAGQTAGIAVPLRVGARITGALAIGTRRQVRYDADDVAVLDLFGSVAGTAIARIEAQAQAERRAERLAALHEVASSLAQENDTERVLKLIAARACALLHGERATVRLWDDEHGDLVVVATHGFVDEPPIPHLRSGEGVSGRAYASGQPIIVNDYESWDGAIVGVRLAGRKAWLAVPFGMPGTRLGTISVSASRTAAFTAQDAELLQLFSQQAALALLQARAIASERAATRRGERLRAAAEFAALAAATADTSQLYREAAERAAALFRADWASVRLYESATQKLELRGIGGPRADVLLPAALPGQGMVGLAFVRGEPVVVNDYQHFSETLPALLAAGMQAGIAVPLRGTARVIGTVSVGTREPIQYESDDVAVLEIFGRVIGAALERVEAQIQAERRADRLRALHEIALSLAQESDPDRVLHLIAARARSLVGADRALLWMWDEAMGALVPAADDGELGDQNVEQLDPRKGASGRAFVTGEPVLIDDYLSWEGAVPSWQRSGVRAAIAAPLGLAHQRLGALTVLAKEPAAFGPQDAELVALFAQQAATALLQARASAAERAATQRGERLAELSALAVEMERQRDEQQVIERTVEAASRLLAADLVRLWLLDPTTDELVAHTTRGPTTLALAPRYPRAALFLGAEALRTGQVVAVDDYRSLPRAWPELLAIGAASIMTAPLLGEDTALGLLGVISFTQRAWAPEDRELVALLAHNAAEAILHTRRLAEQERGTKLDSALRMARTAAHHINNPLAVAVGNLDLLLNGRMLASPEQAMVEQAMGALMETAQAVRALSAIVRVVELEDAGVKALDLDASVRSDDEPPPGPR